MFGGNKNNSGMRTDLTQYSAAKSSKTSSAYMPKSETRHLDKAGFSQHTKPELKYKVASGPYKRPIVDKNTAQKP